MICLPIENGATREKDMKKLTEVQQLKREKI